MSNMIFTSRQIKGKGRGKLMGFPTINVEIPVNFNEEEGIYAVLVWINEKTYKGAMHFGPVPTFNELSRSLEIFVIDAKDTDLKLSKNMVISFELVEKIRDIISFSSQEELTNQIQKDVEEIRNL